MATLELGGASLGQKHQHYNKLVKEFTTTNAPQQKKEIDYNKPDIDNLFQIDIASKEKDVDFIVEVLKCEDMLYVSRALRQSVWLITDEKYADFVNPKYLHDQLLPQMTSKAGNKLMLTIRLNLKDEDRVELFYRYYEDKKEISTAIKWLPNCSISCIEKAVEKHNKHISDKFIKRLCEKSVTIFEICARIKDGYNLRSLLSETMFLLKNNTEKIMNIINTQDKYAIPKFNSKATKLIMEVKPDIILDNFEKFFDKINIPTFVKFIKEEDIKDFLMKYMASKKLKSLFFFENIKHFIFRMPNESRFDFIKAVYIEKVQDNSEDIAYYNSGNDELRHGLRYCMSSRVPQSSNANLYKWYKFAPFSTAFTDLKKLIRVESNPSERNEIFSVLITCAKRNAQNVRTVLQYYRDKHMNEPFKFKSHFVNILLSQSNSHRFDEETWNILNSIFYSMEVYSENENNIQTCLKYIIIHNVVNDKEVPDMVERKFEFDTLKSFQSKLNNEEKEKVFNYLYQLITKKIKVITTNSESELMAIIINIKNVLNLLRDWKKELSNYSVILEKIKEITKMKRNQSWNNDLCDIYNVNKSWRKHMFTESLFLRPTEETCINALKHDPEMLLLNKEIICLNDSIVLNHFHNKLRIFWPKTLAKTYEDTFRNQLNDKTQHKLSVRALCVLLPKQDLEDILRKYIPLDTKISWTDSDDSILSIQKCFAKYMLLARPHPPVDILLSYAKGDYLQFVLPSVHSILFNISRDQSIKHIPTLLDTPVSLQKHGLSIAFAKLKMDELLPICLNTWKSNRNSSIRAVVFKLIFDLLCKEQNEETMKKIWNVLDIFIDSLTPEENRVIYVTLSRAEKVPLPLRQAYCIKSYRYLRTLPPKANCDTFSESIIRATVDIMESTDLDLDFVSEVIFDSFDKKFTTEYYAYVYLISTCLLSSKSEAIQTQRYEKIFVPLLKKYLTLSKDTEVNQKHLKSNFYNILNHFQDDVQNTIINENVIVPTKLFNDIHNDLEKNFSREDYYVIILTWNLAAKYMKVIEKYKGKVTDMAAVNETEYEINRIKRDMIYTEAASDFGKICVEQLKKDIIEYFPSIYILFSKTLRNIFNRFNLGKKAQLATIKAIQENADIIEGHLLVLKVFPRYLYEEDEKDKMIIFQALSSHSSPAVRMHYQKMLRAEENSF